MSTTEELPAVPPSIPPTPVAPARAQPVYRVRSSDGERQLQKGLAIAGSILMPLGLVFIGFGWYGAAHSPYTYEQLSYIASGGFFGLGLVLLGGFLFFGSWLARIAHGQERDRRR